MKYNFEGRPEGLGNRVEELIRLEAIATKYEKKFSYIWNNVKRNRSYPVMLQSPNIEIVLNEEELKLDNEEIYKEWDTFNQKEILEASTRIVPTFKIAFQDDVKPVGIHIRGTDRIGPDHPHYMKDGNEFMQYLLKTIELIKKDNPKQLFVCSDNAEYKKILLDSIPKEIQIVEPLVNADIPGYYVDFFALSMCSKLYMNSKFSTFALCAAMIGNIPIVSYLRDDKWADRYKADFIYELDFSNIKNMLNSKSRLFFKADGFIRSIAAKMKKAIGKASV